MSTKTAKKVISTVSLFFLASLLALASNVTYATWANPTATPPSDNVSAPVNLGADAQVKSGNLGANVFGAVTEMRSPQYCNENGENCFAALPNCANGQYLVSNGDGSWSCQGEEQIVCATGNRVGNSCLFNSAGSHEFIAPNGVTDYTVIVVGGGGGSGNLDHDKWNNYGGAGAGSAKSALTLTPGESYIATVGQGGFSQSAWTNSSGGNGSGSSFQSLSAAGAQGGYRNGYATNANPSTGSGGNIQNCTGGTGTFANYYNAIGGNGQCSGGSGGTGGSGGGASEIGGNGRTGGCGAGGSMGVNGGNGCVLISW